MCSIRRCPAQVQRVHFPSRGRVQAAGIHPHRRKQPEVSIPGADREKHWWNPQDRELIGFCSHQRCRLIGGHGSRDHHESSTGSACGPHSGNHRRSCGEPVIDEHHGLAAQAERRQACAGCALASVQFAQFALRKLFEAGIQRRQVPDGAWLRTMIPPAATAPIANSADRASRPCAPLGHRVALAVRAPLRRQRARHHGQARARLSLAAISVFLQRQPKLAHRRAIHKAIIFHVLAAKTRETRGTGGSSPWVKAYRDLVPDEVDTGRRPRCALSLVALRPRSHLTLEGHLAAVRLNGDSILIDLSASAKRILDFPFDICGGSWRWTLDLRRIRSSHDTIRYLDRNVLVVSRAPAQIGLDISSDFIVGLHHSSPDSPRVPLSEVCAGGDRKQYVLSALA